MLRQGPIPAFLHGLLEYVLGALFIAAPFLFDFTVSAAKAASIVTGVLLLVVTATSALPTGLIKSIPVQGHLVLDCLLAALMIAAPFLFGFDKDGSATPVFIVAGVLYLLLTIATRFVREPSQPTSPTSPEPDDID
jgi:hypothetical protein